MSLAEEFKTVLAFYKGMKWAADYQGKSVPLNKILPGDGKKKYKVYVKDGDKTKKVTFGDPNMSIKRDDPKRQKSFMARHNCANPGPKTKAKYWSCKAWQTKTKLP